MRPFLTVVCLGILVLALAAPAAAAGPARETVSSTDELVILCTEEFSLPYSTSGTATITTFFDQDGNPTRIVTHSRYRNTITTPEGEVLRDYGAANFTYDFGGTLEDFTDDTLFITGKRYNIQIPGEGSVAQDVGLLLYIADAESVGVLFRTAGKTEVLSSDRGLGGLLCPYFMT